MFTFEHIHTASEEQFVQRATVHLYAAIQASLRAQGRCLLGLSGGSTPGPIYALLGRSGRAQHVASLQERIDWSKVHIFLIDERYVPKDHEESNQRLIAETLLACARIPRANIVFPKTTLSVKRCVADYEDRLRALLAESSLDIVILGMGEDGHIASLFPGDRAALEEREKMVLRTCPPPQEATVVRSWRNTADHASPWHLLRRGSTKFLERCLRRCHVSPPASPRLQGAGKERENHFQYTSILKAGSMPERITVTLPLLARAQKIFFLLKGEEKRKTFEEVVTANSDPLQYPAHVLLQTGKTVWVTWW
jgi:6-phosphogluconolactonase